MGAWIEIIIIEDGYVAKNKSHPTMGAWIEISIPVNERPQTQGRTPRWVRGLKLKLLIMPKGLKASHPTMGAWIEIQE